MYRCEERTPFSSDIRIYMSLRRRKNVRACKLQILSFELRTCRKRKPTIFSNLRLQRVRFLLLLAPHTIKRKSNNYKKKSTNMCAEGENTSSRHILFFITTFTTRSVRGFQARSESGLARSSCFSIDVKDAKNDEGRKWGCLRLTQLFDKADSNGRKYI